MPIHLSISIDGVCFAGTTSFVGWTDFFFDPNHFLSGENTIDFVVDNAPPGTNPVGLRVEFLGAEAELGSPTGMPVITFRPEDKEIETGGQTTLVTIARGAEPLNYQWRFNGKQFPIKPVTHFICRRYR